MQVHCKVFRHTKEVAKNAEFHTAGCRCTCIDKKKNKCGPSFLVAYSLVLDLQAFFES